jgi:group I intron endonuclease
VIEVYCHTSPSGKRYVGFSVKGMMRRWKDHVKAALSCKWDYSFHHAIRKYGSKAFRHEILERMTTEAGAKKAEQLWIKELNTFGAGGYNLTSGGEGSAGRKLSVEQRAFLAERVRGFKHTPEAKAKIAAASRGRASGMAGKKQSPEARAKISAALMGNTPTKGMTGRKHSLETIEKMRHAHSFRSPATRAKLSASLTGLKRSPESCAKIGAAKQGTKHSDETRAKMSAAHKARYARLKGAK